MTTRLPAPLPVPRLVPLAVPLGLPLGLPVPSDAPGLPRSGPAARLSRRALLALLLTFPAGLATAQALKEATGPQPTLHKEKLVIVTRDGRSLNFDVEMATTMQEQMTGLMYRTAVPPDGGMLFDWGEPRTSQMWMKNTLVPLDMVFINQDGTIRSIAENTVPHSLATVDSHGPVRATLELGGGVTAKDNIRVGDVVHAKIFGNAQ